MTNGFTPMFQSSDIPAVTTDIVVATGTGVLAAAPLLGVLGGLRLAQGKSLFPGMNRKKSNNNVRSKNKSVFGIGLFGL